MGKRLLSRCVSSSFGHSIREACLLLRTTKKILAAGEHNRVLLVYGRRKYREQSCFYYCECCDYCEYVIGYGIMSLALQEPIAVPESEERQVQELSRLLHRGRAALISASGEKVEFPDTLYEVLTRIVEILSQGQAVTLVPDNQVVTTQRAATILGMSRPFFIKLLEAGVMAHHRVGNQRRVYLRDVLDFARKREQERKAALDRLSRNASEAGLYERNVWPEGGEDE